MLQRGAFQQLHGDERLPILLADVMNRADVGMVQRGSRLRLALKPRQRLRIFCHIVGKEFQRDKTVQPGVLGLVHHAHSPAPKSFQDAVMRKRLPYQRIGTGHVPLILWPTSSQVNAL